jgi:hypothetical protein
MLAERGEDLDRRFGQPQARCCFPTHADPQDQLTAKRCEASAEPMIVCRVASTEAITIAEVVAKRCGASAKAIAQASSARDAEKIRGPLTTVVTDLMF